MRTGSFILFCISLFWCAQGLADPAVLTGASTQLPIDENVFYLEDPDGELTLEQFVAKEPQELESNQAHVFAKGYSTSVWWLRVNPERPGRPRLRG